MSHTTQLASAEAQTESFPTPGPEVAAFAPTVLVDADSGRKPKTVNLLSDWAYIEHSLMRLLAAWGRYAESWDDKVAWHRHLWEQSECVQKLRDRLTEFPGTTGNLDAPVSPRLEKLVNTVLLAPSFQDAVSGIHDVLQPALSHAYQMYGGAAHPVHDAPTLSALHQVQGFKTAIRLWVRDYRRRHPHEIDATYRESIERELAACGHLLQPLPVEKGAGAAPCGVNTDFQLPARPARPCKSVPQFDLYRPIEAEFTTNIEARRLFWCVAYMLEMTLAEGMLGWIWGAHHMPWAYQKELARHLWDESRHGDSGHSRLKDFGISLEDIGYPRFGADARGPLNEQGEVDSAPNMTPKDLFDAAFFIGMVAETGHFTVKNEAYQDFKDGGDLESAEMMIFDIIDEGAHVRYCHDWLPELARHAEIDLGDYRARAAEIRAQSQRQADERAAQEKQTMEDASDPTVSAYRQLIEKMRQIKPLSNATTCPPRSGKPM